MMDCRRSTVQYFEANMNKYKCLSVMRILLLCAIFMICANAYAQTDFEHYCAAFMGIPDEDVLLWQAGSLLRKIPLIKHIVPSSSLFTVRDYYLNVVRPEYSNSLFSSIIQENGPELMTILQNNTRLECEFFNYFGANKPFFVHQATGYEVITAEQAEGFKEIVEKISTHASAHLQQDLSLLSLWADKFIDEPLAEAFGYLNDAEITLLAPQGGDTLFAGTTQTIRWECSGFTDPVMIFFNDGSGWMPLSGNGSENDGLFEWTVPVVSSGNCRLLVEGAALGRPKDKSHYFTVLPIPADSAIAKLEFASSPQIIDNASVSAKIAVVLKNASGQTVPLRGMDLALTLSSDSPQGQFSLSNSPFSSVSSIVIHAGNYKAEFYYKDSRPGIAHLDVAEMADLGWMDASQSIEITRFGRFEAENLSLNGMLVMAYPGAGNEQVVKPDSPYGASHFFYYGPSGHYKLSVRYLDECNGRSEGLLKLNGATVADWRFDETPANETEIWREKEIAALSLDQGDIVSYRVYPDSGEQGLVDYLQLIHYVLVDTIPPSMSVEVVDGHSVQIQFSEPVLNALDSTRYAFSPELGAISVAEMADNSYLLTTQNSQTAQTSYTLSLSALTDTSGNLVSPDSALFSGFIGIVPFRIEIESLTLSNLVPESWNGRSGNSVVRFVAWLQPGEYGWAKYYFDRTEGDYVISVPYYDEDTGITDATLRLNGTTINGWDWDCDQGGTWEVMTPSPRTLHAGDVIMLKMYKDGEESGYLDYLQFTPAGLLKPAMAISGPERYQLYQNYPNPFNSLTRIRYDLPTAGKISIKIFNIRGQAVSVLLDAARPAGTYVIYWNAANFASGIYWCRMEAGKYSKAIKILLIK